MANECILPLFGPFFVTLLIAFSPQPHFSFLFCGLLFFLPFSAEIFFLVMHLLGGEGVLLMSLLIGPFFCFLIFLS